MSTQSEPIKSPKRIAEAWKYLRKNHNGDGEGKHGINPSQRLYLMKQMKAARVCLHDKIRDENETHGTIKKE